MDVQESLLPSAQAFLIQSLRDLGSGNLDFAVLHGVTAVELTLKERLRLINPGLVLRDIDGRPSSSRQQTVALDCIPERLANLSMPLNKADVLLVRDMARWRNEVVHHLASYNREHARQQVPRLLDFIAAQLRDRLGAPLESFLPRDLFRNAKQC
jgi:hypothetical protein